MNNNFDGTDNYIDSRDIEERINEMELEYGPEEGDSIDTIHTEKMEDHEREEYEALIELRDEAGYVFDNQESFIADHFFEEWTEEFLKDVGYLPQDLPSWIEIDWATTAENVKVDYTSYEFRGTTYWARS